MSELDISSMNDEEIEEQARGQGWKPEDEWKGDPPSRGFVSAKEFLEAGQKSLPLLTQQKGQIEEELEALKADSAKMKAAMRRYKAMTDKAMDTARRERDAAIESLQNERAQAISEADGDKVIEIERKIAQTQAEPIGDEEPPGFAQEWLAENAWYEDDEEMAAVADGISTRLKQDQPHLVGQAHLDELSKRVKKAMPHKFKNPRRDDPSPVEPARRSAPTNGRSFEDLPKDAQQAYEDFKEMFAADGVNYTKKQYLATYEWDE
jgi:hypothetical protein